MSEMESIQMTINWESLEIALNSVKISVATGRISHAKSNLLYLLDKLHALNASLTPENKSDFDNCYDDTYARMVSAINKRSEIKGEIKGEVK